MTGREITIVGYLVLVLAIMAVEFVGRREGSSVLTFSQLVTLVASTPLGRAGLLTLWWWVGWHFLARGGAPPF